MKHYNISWTEGYSIITAILMIGFLLVLTVSTFNLVLQEMQDGKGRENYMKAYAGAEWALELALLQIKEKGYGFYEEKSDIEYFWPAWKNGIMNYDINSETKSYTGTLLAGEYSTDIIPLFTLNASWDIAWITTLELDDRSWWDLVWNVIEETGGLSGKGSFRHTDTQTIGVREIVNSGGNKKLELQNKRITDLIWMNKWSYLALQNLTWWDIVYVLSSDGFFTQPKSIIESSAQVGKYTQNLNTTVDNSEFLGILKYSIYSGN